MIKVIKNVIYHLKLIKNSTFADSVNNGYRLKLATDYIRWILFFKYRGRDWRIRFDNGLHSIVKPFPDHDSGSMNIWTRNVDFRALEFVRTVLRAGDTLLDLGCNVGNRTWAVADVLGGAIMVDANVKAVSRAIENRQLNGLPEEKFQILQLAIGDKPGSVQFSDYGGAATHNKIITEEANAGGVVNVEMTTIDLLVDKHNFAPAFIKIDVEGYDLAALKGARKTLGSGTVRLVQFEVLQKGLISEFEKYFEEIGWKIFSLDPSGRPTMDREILFSQLNLFAAPSAVANNFFG